MPSSTSSSDHYPLPVWEAFSWRKLLLVLLAWLALWFAGDRLGSIALQAIADRSQFRFAKLYAGGNDYDYVILGSSRALNSFYVPELNELWGLNGINLSYNGMSIFLMELFFRDYLQVNKAPRILLIEITGLNIKPYNMIENMRPFLGYSSSLLKSYREHNPVAYWVTEISHLYRFNSELYLRLLSYLNRSDQTWTNFHSMDEAFAADYLPVHFGRSDFGLPLEANLEALKQILGLAKENAITVKFIVAPYFLKHIENVDGYFEWKQEIEQQFEGVPLLDLSRAVRDPKAFFDPVHLNRQGSKKMTQILIEEGIFETD